MRRNIEGEGFRCTSNFSKGLKLFKIKLGGKVKPPRLLWREPNMRRTGRQGPSCPTPPADWGSVLGLGPSSVALPQWPPEVLCAHGRLALGQSVKLWTQKKSPWQKNQPLHILRSLFAGYEGRHGKWAGKLGKGPFTLQLTIKHHHSVTHRKSTSLFQLLLKSQLQLRSVRPLLQKILYHQNSSVLKTGSRTNSHSSIGF